MTERWSRQGLYAITPGGPLNPATLFDQVAHCLQGGARVVQYRDKTGTAEHRLEVARRLLRLCREFRVPLLINDDPALALAVGADGVHLGREDPDLAQARQRLGPGAIIGISCYNRLDLALAAEAGGADYLAFGRFFASATKPQAVAAGLELLREARARLRRPIVAIGGITPENGGALVQAGADLLAVIQGVFGQPDIQSAARAYSRLFPLGDTRHESVP